MGDRREHAGRTQLLHALHDGFLAAKVAVQQQYRHDALKQHMSVITPWFSELFADNRALLGDDWWPHGLARNRAALDTFLRYSHEQGRARRLLTSADIIVPVLLDT